MLKLTEKIGFAATRGSILRNSVVYDGARANYLSRLFASAGNRQKFSIAYWLNPVAGHQVDYFFAGNGGADLDWMHNRRFQSTKNSGSASNLFLSDMESNPVGEWHHWLFIYDSAQGTPALRGRSFYDGVELTYTTQTLPTQNFSTPRFMNTGSPHKLGSVDWSLAPRSSNFKGNYAQFIVADGIVLTPAEVYNNGPKEYTGAVGPQGSTLLFENASNLGEAALGHDWIVNGTLSQSVDVPG